MDMRGKIFYFQCVKSRMSFCARLIVVTLQAHSNNIRGKIFILGNIVLALIRKNIELVRNAIQRFRSEKKTLPLRHFIRDVPPC